MRSAGSRTMRSAGSDEQIRCSAIVMRRGGREFSEQAMRFVLHARGEIDAVRIAVRAAVAGHEGPEIADHDLIAAGIVHRAEEMEVVRIVGINPPVPEIPNQKVVGEFPEALSRAAPPRWPRR